MTTVNTRTPTHMLPAEQPQWTLLSSDTALHFPTSCAWSNSCHLSILQVPAEMLPSSKLPQIFKEDSFVQSPHSVGPELLCMPLRLP